MIVHQKIELLRTEMFKHNVSACIIANADPHLSEYIADYWKEREWISGFTGSNGIIVLTQHNMSLWTDSRYELQAKQQLQGIESEIFITSSFALIANWLENNLNAENQKIAIRSDVFSVNAINEIKHEFSKRHLNLFFYDLISPIWNNRPSIPAKKLFLLEEKFTGKSTKKKLLDIRKEMMKANADVFLITALDEIAWTFNIRGYDIPYNPLVIAYAAIEKHHCTLFINKEKLDLHVEKYFEEQEIAIQAYEEIKQYVSAISKKQNVLIDHTKTSFKLAESINKEATIIQQLSPVALLKSIKNETEIAGIKNACVKDGLALVHFCMWLEENIKNKTVTELTIAEKLKFYRQKQDLYFGESFGTIAGYQEHGAIVHYSATKESNANILPKGFLLIDSGGQYFDGTTDITRTLALGELSEQQKTDYTLVLKGHIALATARFPYGTCGYQLDILARHFLWNKGLNYGHGTGHGVGHFLNVHEGPQSIRPDNNTTRLEKGMVLSNEPGIYRANEYGIRIENMIMVKEDVETHFGKFLQFETLTLFPIAKNAIDFNLLNKDELEWLNKYNKKVFDKLSPHLNTEENIWLTQNTK